jgi:hypothetical protein
MTLEENIKHWIQLDNNIKQLNLEIKNIKSQKEIYNNNILKHITTNQLDNAIVKIGNDKLRFMDTNYSQPLTYKFIYECLSKYYDDDNDKAIEIIQFIKSQRQIKIIKEIKRFNKN